MDTALEFLVQWGGDALAVLAVIWLILREVAPRTSGKWDNDLLNVIEGAANAVGMKPEQLASRGRQLRSEKGKRSEGSQRRALAVPVLMLLGGALTACAGAVPGNPQGYAGINRGVVELEQGVPTRVEVIGGKEQGRVALEGETPDGLRFRYEASDVRAFDGQRARAAVEEAVSEDAKEAFPGIVDAILDSLIKALGT